MNSEKLQGKINNLSNYLQYCESLKNILETTPMNNLNNQENQLKGIENNLQDIDLYIDFFDEMNGIVSEYDTKNKQIEKKINKLEEKL